MPVPEKTSMNEVGVSAVSISTVRSASFPSRSRRRRLSRVALSGGVAGGAARGGGQQHVEQPLLGVLAGAAAHPFALLFAQHGDGGLGQVAHHRVDVAADVAHLGELGGFHLDEGGAGQLGQAAGDLGLAHAGGADHHDVLGGDLVAQGGRHLLPAPAVAQGHRHGALGGALAHDVAVQLFHDGARGERFGRARGVAHGVTGGH
jgi:hypothetical protein